MQVLGCFLVVYSCRRQGRGGNVCSVVCILRFGLRFLSLQCGTSHCPKTISLFLFPPNGTGAVMTLLQYPRMWAVGDFCQVMTFHSSILAPSTNYFQDSSKVEVIGCTHSAALSGLSMPTRFKDSCGRMKMLTKKWQVLSLPDEAVLLQRPMLVLH